MRVSQLLHVMDKDDDIVVHDYDKPIDQSILYQGTVRGIYKDNPINRMHVLSVCAAEDVISVLVRKENDTHRRRCAEERGGD